MKALVIGGTGIIGNHVIRSLLAEGITVRAFSRGLTPSLNLAGLDVERCQGDLNDFDSLLSAMRGCDWIFHTAPYYPTTTFDLAGHIKNARAGMQKVIDACASLPITRLVYTSSLTTIGRADYFGELATEDCRYQPVKCPPHPYFQVKFIMEEMVRLAAHRGLPAIIVNPTGCFGPFELKPPNLCLIPQLVNRTIPAYVDGLMNVVDVADVGRGHVLAAERGRVGMRYLLGGPNITVEQLIRKICLIARVEPPALKVPIALAVIPAWISEWIARYVLHTTPALPILGLRFIQHGQHFDLTRATSELGLKSSPIEPALERAIAWFRKIRYC